MESKYAGMSPYNYSFNNPIMFNDLNGADPGDERKIAPQVSDATSVAKTPVTNNALPYTTPTGGSITLPQQAKAISFFDDRSVLLSGLQIGQAVDGSLWNYSYLGEQYTAKFNKEGEFFGYYSTTNSAHFVNASLNMMPSPPRSNWDIAMTRIEGGVQFLAGSVGAVGSAFVAGGTGGLAALPAYAAGAYSIDQAAAGLNQAITGSYTGTFYQQGLSALGASPAQVQAIDMYTGYMLGAKVGSMAPSMPSVQPVSKLPFNPTTFADEIIELNKATDGGGILFNGTPSSAINSAMYYDNIAEQGAAIFRSISHGHMFENGNKRTAVAAFKSFAGQNG